MLPELGRWIKLMMPMGFITLGYVAALLYSARVMGDDRRWAPRATVARPVLESRACIR